MAPAQNIEFKNAEHGICYWVPFPIQTSNKSLSIILKYLDWSFGLISPFSLTLIPERSIPFLKLCRANLWQIELILIFVLENYHFDRCARSTFSRLANKKIARLNSEKSERNSTHAQKIVISSRCCKLTKLLR